MRGSPHSAERHELRSVARTHIGRTRTINEDRLLDCPERGLWAVADGMGGHSAGDVAAAATIRALFDLSMRAVPITSDGIRLALAGANAEIHDRATREARDSGSTIAGLWIDRDRFAIFWAGDSRIYRHRAGELELLSHDHSLVQELVDSGSLAPEAAVGHPHSNVITRAIGIEPEVKVDFLAGQVLLGDRFMLCSDGLSGLVSEGVLSSTLARPGDDAAERLLNAALAAGGTDNISLIIIDLPLR